MSTLLQKIYTELHFNHLVKNQSDFANKLDLGKSYISKLLKLNEVLPTSARKKLMSVFGITEEYLDSNGTKGSMFKIPLNNWENAQGKAQPLQPTKNNTDMQLIDKLIDYIINDGKEKTEIIKTLSRKLPDVEMPKYTENPLEQVG